MKTIENVPKMLVFRLKISKLKKCDYLLFAVTHHFG